MSVPKYLRKDSRVEFLNNFFKLRVEVIKYLMRDFGIKARNYSLRLTSDIYNIEEEDQKELDLIFEKYGISGIDVDKYPEWLINTWRNEILMILNNIGISLYCANSIYISNIQEYYTRRNHLNSAIGFCAALIDKFNEVISCINVSIKPYEHICDMIQREIRLIKGVRKYDNKLLKNLNTEVSPYANDVFYYTNYPMFPNSETFHAELSSALKEDDPSNEHKIMCRLI